MADLLSLNIRESVVWEEANSTITPLHSEFALKKNIS
jgi:hypothetical protein